MMQPVILRPRGGSRYELVAGERRWRAATQAGLTQIPALVRELTDEQSAEWAIIENVQREDLNPMERAWAFQALAQRFGLTHQQIADRVGLDRSTVANTIRLTELEEPIRDMIASGRLSAGHGRALLAAPPGATRSEMAIQASDEGWSVRRLERAAATAAGLGEPTPPLQDGSSGGADLAKMAARTSLEKQLGEHLGTKVTITTDRSGARGRMSIEFYGVDHFDGLMNKFGFKLR
jgi:ParB family transcriptional regulator, chromosome partitioning protein